MTGSPPIPPQVSVGARPGVLRRLKLTEPARLYLYGLATVAVLGLTMAGVLTDDWSGYWVHVAAVVLGVVPATEAVRASVYSPRGHYADLWRVGSAAITRSELDTAAGW